MNRPSGGPQEQIMSDRYAVIGNPIGHSQSPRIHAAFAAQTGADLTYTRLLGEAPRFAAQVREFFATGGCGLNVTVPFKEAAWELATELGPQARAAGAVNTLSPRAGGGLRGDNTDGLGLVRDLTRNHRVALTGRRVLLLGAGGAARGVLRPLLEQEPAELVVANRTAARAVTLVAGLAGPVSGCGLEALSGRCFDVMINATAAGLEDRVPALPEDSLMAGGVTYDMMYGNQPTAFVRWGRTHGAGLALDGLGMLVEQAAEAFFLWRGLRPETAPVVALLRGG
jgi:shikimate dehydrogenase